MCFSISKLCTVFVQIRPYELLNLVVCQSKTLNKTEFINFHRKKLQNTKKITSTNKVFFLHKFSTFIQFRIHNTKRRHKTRRIRSKHVNFDRTRLNPDMHFSFIISLLILRVFQLFCVQLFQIYTHLNAYMDGGIISLPYGIGLTSEQCQQMGKQY